MLHPSNHRNEKLTPRSGSWLLLGVIMALALASYFTIAAHASKSLGGGIFEIAASNLAYADLLPAAQSNPGQPAARLSAHPTTATLRKGL